MSIQHSTAGRIAEKYLKPLAQRENKTWEITKDYTARESFAFSKPGLFGRSKEIDSLEAAERIAEGESVAVERALVVRWQDESETRLKRKEQVLIKDQNQLSKYAEEHGHKGPPTKVFALETEDGEQWIHPANYSEAWKYDHDGDFRITRGELSAEAGPEGYADLLRDRLASEGPNRSVASPQGVSNALKEAQSQAVLRGDIEEALRLAEGEQSLISRRLTSVEPGLALAKLVDEIGQDESVERIRRTLQTEPMKLMKASRTRDAALAYHALSEGVKAAASGTMFPPAPLVSDLMQRVEKIRLSSPDPRNLAKMSRFDALLRKAKPEDSLTELFHNVRKDEETRKTFGDLLNTVGSDAAVDGLQSVNFESLARRAGTNLQTGELDLYHRRGEDVLQVIKKKKATTDDPALLASLEEADRHLSRRLQRLSELNESILARKEEEAVNRVVISVYEDDAVERFLARAGEKVDSSLVDSRVELDLSRFSNIEDSAPIVEASPEEKKSAAPRGYLAREEVFRALDLAQANAFFAGNLGNAATLAAGHEALMEFQGDHNGEIFAAIFEAAGSAELETMKPSDFLKSEGPEAKAVLAYHALTAVGEPMENVDPPTMTAIAKQLDSGSALHFGNPEAMEILARGRRVLESAAKTGGWDVGIQNILKEPDTRQLPYLLKALNLSKESEHLAPARKILEGGTAVPYFRGSLQSDLQALQSKLAKVKSAGSQEKLKEGIAVVRDRLERLDQFANQVQKAEQESEINALVQSVLEDQSLTSAARKAELEADTAIVEARTDWEIASIENSAAGRLSRVGL